MKDRTTQVLLAIVAVLLTAHLFRSDPGISAARADETAKVPPILRAESFELVNKQGKVRSTLPR